MQMFLAEIAYSSKDLPCNERATTIRYMAINEFNAAIDAMRWFKSRHSCIPDWYTKPLCIKLYGFQLHVVDQDGGLGSETGMPLFEWKCDTAGLPYEQYADWRLGGPRPRR